MWYSQEGKLDPCILKLQSVNSHASVAAANLFRIRAHRLTSPYVLRLRSGDSYADRNAAARAWSGRLHLRLRSLHSVLIIIRNLGRAVASAYQTGTCAKRVCIKLLF